MGGSNSKQEDKANTSQLNKHQRRETQLEAQRKGLDVELLATQCQKTDKTYEQE